MKYIRTFNKFVFFALIAAFFSFIVSSLWEIITLMVILRTFDLHNVDATIYQPSLYSVFYIFFIIFFYILATKKTPFSVS